MLILKKFERVIMIEKIGAGFNTKNVFNKSFNKFSNKTGKVLEDIGLKSLSGAPRFEHATAKQIAEQLSSMNMFEKIL